MSNRRYGRSGSDVFDSVAITCGIMGGVKHQIPLLQIVSYKNEFERACEGCTLLGSLRTDRAVVLLQTCSLLRTSDEVYQWAKNAVEH
jgi:hypothetical protein